MPSKRRGVKRRDRAGPDGHLPQPGPKSTGRYLQRAAREVTVPRVLSPEVSMLPVHPCLMPGVCRTCVGTGAALPVLPEGWGDPGPPGPHLRMDRQ